jgi:hypothetical protein
MLSYQRTLDRVTQANIRGQVRETRLRDIYLAGNETGWEGIRRSNWVYESSAGLNYSKSQYTSQSTFSYEEFKVTGGHTVTRRSRIEENLTLFSGAVLSYWANLQYYKTESFDEILSQKLIGSHVLVGARSVLFEHRPTRTRVIGTLSYTRAQQDIEPRRHRAQQDSYDLGLVYEY